MTTPRTLILLPSLLLTALLASCAGPGGPSGGFTAPTQVQGMKVNPIKVATNAYRPPVGSEGDTLHGWGNTAAHLSGGDNIVMAAAGNVGRGIARGQQNDFVEKNQAAFSAIQRSMIREAPASVQNAVLASLRPTALGPRLDKKPVDSALYVDLENFGLVRIGLSPSEEVLLAPQITFNVQTTSSQVLVNGAWVNMDATNATRDFSKMRVNKAAFWTYRANFATGTTGHTLREYAANPALLRTELLNTATTALQNVPQQVAQQFGSK